MGLYRTGGVVKATTGETAKITNALEKFLKRCTPSFVFRRVKLILVYVILHCLVVMVFIKL